MVERLLCKQEVIGSIPFTSTTRSVRAIGDERQLLAQQGAKAPGAVKPTGTGLCRRIAEARGQQIGLDLLSSVFRDGKLFDMVKSVLLRAEAVASGGRALWLRATGKDLLGAF